MKKGKKGILSNFQLEFRTQLKIAMLAALGFIVAFSWKDFIATLLNMVISKLDVTEKLYLYQLISAIAVTVIAVIIMVFLSKINITNKKTDEADLD